MQIEKLTAWIDNQVAMAKADVETMFDTVDRHDCRDCRDTLRNKRVRLQTLEEVQKAAAR